jgi:hypothetical protein
VKYIKSVVLFLLIYSCAKDNIFDEIGFFGEGNAKLNGEIWKGKTGVFKSRNYCTPDTCIGILLYKYNAFGELRGKILIDYVSLKIGKFQLNPIEPFYLDTFNRISYSEFTSDGDVVTGTYILKNPSPDYYIEIKELNKQNGDIRGSFRAKVVRDTSFIGKFPDTINIEDGNFYGRINWR